MSEPTRRPQPIILIRGFGGFDTAEERRDTYQRYNVGTVYPQKQGENYIYEGMVLRLIKSNWLYQDATNVVGYYSKEKNNEPQLPNLLRRILDPDTQQKFQNLNKLGYFQGKVVIDPGMALHLLETIKDPWHTFWVFRYYDLEDRQFNTYGKALVRLIDFIRELTVQKTGIKPKVNIIAHSMGGLLVREAIQTTYPAQNREAKEYINKIVTLGTPHQGITFQILQNWLNFIEAENELERFYPAKHEDNDPKAYYNFQKYFPLERLLTVVGTNYQTYKPFNSMLNRLFPMPNEFGINYNKSDGLVKQKAAQIPGAPRTFVHKCHGGNDSLISSREAYEIATRFFLGDVQVRLRFVEGKATLGMDIFGKSEFFLGVSIKPRGVDFDLFHQSKAAENCYGPFTKSDANSNKRNVNFSETNDELAFPWADEDKLIWQGYLHTSKIIADARIEDKDLVMRLDFLIGERDLYGIGFSDNVIFRKHYYIRALLERNPLELYLHTNDRSVDGGKLMEMVGDGCWQFVVEGTGFKGIFQIELDKIPLDGQPVAL
ncbi:MAG: hypothetical protein SAJ37_11825 [Oscillatoria sp. PMC 1068.18]|nr:hypothetical protein [Oscillatoria sp. PMC 1076.18]MEC4989429.1 hypothetical protein [Oscillatoria sp. PMC 1068.18]